MDETNRNGIEMLHWAGKRASGAVTVTALVAAVIGAGLLDQPAKADTRTLHAVSWWSIPQPPDTRYHASMEEACHLAVAEPEPSVREHLESRGIVSSRFEPASGATWCSTWGGASVPQSCTMLNGKGEEVGGECFTGRAACADGTVWDTGVQGCVVPDVRDRMAGRPRHCGGVGNPCDPATGNKFEAHADFRSSRYVPAFVRYYNSVLVDTDVGLGFGWRSNLHAGLEIDGAKVLVREGDGRGEVFTCAAEGACAGTPGVRDALHRDEQGYTLRSPVGVTHRYDREGRLLTLTDPDGNRTVLQYAAGSGRLQSVSGPHGHTLAFGYDALGRLVTFTDPGGGIYRYGYDPVGNLENVIFPDATPHAVADNPVRRYHYESSVFPHHLTGVTDENGDRYSTFAYDEHGRAILSEHARVDGQGPREQFRFEYIGETETRVLTSAGMDPPVEERRVYSHNRGVKNLIRVEQVGVGHARTQVFDSRNNLVRRQDGAGRVVLWTYNADNQLTSVTRAAGTAEQRTVRYGDYVVPGVHLPRRIVRPSVHTGSEFVTTVEYDAAHRPERITERGFRPDGTPVSRSVTLQYHADGKLRSLGGPRTDLVDVTTFEYWNCFTGGACGQLKSVTDAAGHVTRFEAYDASGRLLVSREPDGLVKRYTYDVRGRLVRILETAASGATRRTGYEYDPAGRLTRVRAANGRILTYTYDAAHDLRAVSDALGNRIEFAYDQRGNRVSEAYRDSRGVLTRSRAYSHDSRNRIASIDRAGAVTSLVHDAVGNLVSIFGPDGGLSAFREYDSLGRLRSIADALGGTTHHAYDVTGRLARITDPRGNTTEYVHDDLGNRLAVRSPDSGVTTFDHDEAGNVVSRTDARQVTATVTHDARNRVSAVSYPDAADSVQIHYDQSGPVHSNGVGRLTHVSDGSGSTDYGYDPWGEVSAEHVTIDGRDGMTAYELAYGRDPGGAMESLTYPSGLVVRYLREPGTGHVSDVRVRVEHLDTGVAGSIRRAPFGPVTSLTYGNGLTLSVALDLDHRIEGISVTAVTGTPVVEMDYERDGEGNIVRVTDARDPARSVGYGYDALGRLVSAHGPVNFLEFDYDSLGNRTARVVDGTPTAYAYEATSNRMTEITGPDAPPIRHFAYDSAGRLRAVHVDGAWAAEYHYNAQGERVIKRTADAEFHYVYGPDGELLGEYTSTGSPIAEYIYLDRRPLAMLRSGELYYYHNDHLGTPRLMTDAEGGVVWRARYEPFGQAHLEVEQIENNLRFPGQYFDRETGLHYNCFRDYEPATGRYVESDPVGLFGGPNTYLYADGSPVGRSDPLGLWSVSVGAGGTVHWNAVGVGASTSFSADSTGRVCAQFTTCGGLGYGYFVGLGITGGLSSENLCDGDSETDGPYYEGGVGLGGSGTIQFSSGGISGATGLFGVGSGYAGGIQHCRTRNICL